MLENEILACVNDNNKHNFVDPYAHRTDCNSWFC